MRTIDEIRHARLLELIQEAGSVQALADKLGKSHSQISQLKTRARYNESGGRKSVGTSLAREIEEKLGLQSGWMDTDPAACCAGTATEYAHGAAHVEPLPERTRQVAWRAAANRLAEVAERNRTTLDPITFMLFVDAALEDLADEVSEAAAEQVFRRWLPVISRGRAQGHHAP